MRTISKGDVEGGFGRIQPGRHLCCIAAVKVKKSRRGQEMWELTLALDSDPTRRACWDNVMMEGKGRGIALKKLKEIGAARELEDSWEVDEPGEIQGKRVWVTFVLGKSTTGKDRLEPDFNSPGFGYEHYSGTEAPF